MQRKLPMVLAALLVGIVFDGLFFDKTIGVSAVLFTAVILACVWIQMRRAKLRPSPDMLLLGLGGLTFSSLLMLRASPLLGFINIVAVAYLLVLLVNEVANRQTWRQLTSRQFIRIVFMVPLAMLTEFFAFFEPQPEKQTPKPRSRGYSAVVRGILLSIPVLLIFGLLFSSADLVFGNYARSLISIFDFEWRLPPTLPAQLVIVGIASGLALSAFALMFRRRKPEPSTANRVQGLHLGNTETAIVLGSVATLFLIFVLIQVTYLFGGADKVIAGGYTFAEYARKGFFELIAATVITLGIILALSRATIRRNLRQKVLFMWLSGSLIVETFIIMLSASRRLSLYEQTYGFTELRLYSHLFIGWLAVLFAILLVQILREQERTFGRQVFVTAVAVVALLNIINPDAWIARKNIGRYYQTGKLDIMYLNTLSEDAIPTIADQLNSPDTKLTRNLNSLLYYQKPAILGERNKSWQALNISRERAKNILKGKDKNIPAVTAPSGLFMIGPEIDNTMP